MNVKILSIGCALTLLAATAGAQQQLGSDIDGEAALDQCGYQVSLSADGRRLAVSAIGNDGNGDDSGHVRVFQWSGTAWDRLGEDIDGEAAGDGSGENISLSDDGKRLAVGAPLNDGGGENAGHARVFQWSGTAWEQLGGDIDDDDAFDWGGYVSLSGDGKRVAVGAVDYTYVGDYSGHVRVFEWSGSAWNPLGTTIPGENNEDNFGYAVSLSKDGRILAVGGLRNNGNGRNSGHVRVFSWSGSAWEQMGADLDGEAAQDIFGASVSLSADGMRLAAGAPQNDGIGIDSGHARVFEWSGAAWVQLGADIDAEAMDDRNGFSVSLSADGVRIAVGAAGNDASGGKAGHARLFEWSGSEWLQLGGDIDGEGAGDLSGAVSLSADGSRLAVGSPFNDGAGEDAGQARVFSFATAPDQVGFNGLFYDAANSGHGFDVNVHELGVTVFYYGHTSGGERLWLISGLTTEAFEFGVPYRLEMHEVTDGTFGHPVEPSTYWGTITLTFTDCDSGHAEFSGIEGDMEMDLVRLVGLAGLDCGPAP